MKLKKHSSGVYYAHVTTPTGTKPISTKATTKEDAQKIVTESRIREIELAARAGRLTQQTIGLLVSGKRLTIEKSIEEFQLWMTTLGRSPVSVTNTITFVKAWARDMGTFKFPPASITEKNINPWVNDPDSKSKAGSRAVKLSALRSFFGFCAAKGWTAGDPSRLVRVNMNLMSHAQKEPTERQPFTDAEVEKLLSNAKPSSFWHSAIVIGRYTGLRLGDICQLEWDCFDKPGKIIVWTDKRDRRVELPLEPAALEEAIAAIPEKDNLYCFPVERQIYIDPRRKSLFSVQFRRLCEKQDIKDKSFHCLRVTYATACHKAGVPMRHISGSLGHRQERTTRRYVRE